ncbi:MAG: DUF5011 domain-containing protein [Blastocatellia bacterium]
MMLRTGDEDAHRQRRGHDRAGDQLPGEHRHLPAAELDRYQQDHQLYGDGCTANASIDNGSFDPDSGDTITVTQSPAGPYPLGSTTVTLTVTDSHGAFRSCSSTVTVVDQTAPAITLYGANPMTVECPYGFVDPGAAATDNCAGSVAVTKSGSVNTAVPGSYTITYTANDGVNTATKTHTVNVVDSIAPALTLKPDIQLWPPNHGYHTVTMSQMVQSVSDGCSTSLGINDVKIEKVTSDEPDNAPGDADGNTTNDIVIAADCRSAQLRAERDETKNGRVYVITLRVRDAAGKETRKDFKVSVPINQSGAAAVQDGTAVTPSATPSIHSPSTRTNLYSRVDSKTRRRAETTAANL